MHDLDFDHEHTDEELLAIAEAIWEQETVDMLTVGIDIGSSTTHLLFARVILRRQQFELSSRFVVTERRIVWRSPIMLTPFLDNETIDAEALRSFFQKCYQDAGYQRSDIDSGAVILTGEAIKRKNARAIDELFASESGKFVCATAGHRLESILAAHGSGATTLSENRHGVSLHVDIGGGTTKLALIDHGVIKSVAAFAVGGRLLAKDAEGSWNRIDDTIHLVAKSFGMDPTPETFANEANRMKVIKRMAELAVDQIVGADLDELGQSILLTDPLDRTIKPDFLTFSGGVSEYIFDYENHDYGDIAKPLAKEIIAQLKLRNSIPLVDAGQRIRATVIGASQFTVQVSGKTLYMNDPAALPAYNVPVIQLDMELPEKINSDEIAQAFLKAVEQQDRDPDSLLALAFNWSGTPDHQRLHDVASGILKGFTKEGLREKLLVLVIDGDVGQSLGRLIDKEMGYKGSIICLDGIQLKELDFIDIGEFMDPPGVVPVVIKSLLFS